MKSAHAAHPGGGDAAAKIFRYVVVVLFMPIMLGVAFLLIVISVFFQLLPLLLIIFICQMAGDDKTADKLIDIKSICDYWFEFCEWLLKPHP